MRHVSKLPPGTEKRRLDYLLFAFPIALILGSMDLLNYWGLELLAINGIVSSVLLYFILLIIAYPQLRELHDYFARTLVIFVSTVTGAVIIYFAVPFFNGRPPSFTGLLIASFLIVISFSPMKMVLRKIFSYFYPESKDVFTSLYEFDEKLEREKAMMLAEMAPVVAHEIRNPLGSIKGAAQYLKTEASTEEQKELLNVIVEGTDRLNNVVSQFLNYARPYKLNLKIQNINIIIQKAISIIAVNKLVENITIVQELDEDLPDAEVDEQQFMQVILNMALNAIESMPRGGTLIFCTSSGESDIEGMISLTIRDSGAGIGRKDLKEIFKPFFTTKERGVGLGLAICQKIIKEHGGSISVTSIPSQGTTFIIRLKTAI
jgi:signal transduction histidine kinase